jgi:TolA-binding protein
MFVERSATSPFFADHSRTKGAAVAKKLLDGEKATASILGFAKTFVQSKKPAVAREYCEKILTRYPHSRAAEEARELLERLKK